MAPNADMNMNSRDEINFKEVVLKVGECLRFLRSKLLIISIAGLFGAGLGLAYAFLKKPVYVADLSFALDDEKSGGGLGAAMGLASQFGIDLGGTSGGGAFSSDNLLGLMQSRAMVENALISPVIIDGKRRTIAELYIDFNNYLDAWKEKSKLKCIMFPAGLERDRFTLQQDSVLGKFYNEIVKNNLIVDKIDKKSSIITVKVSSKNELFSKLFAEELVKTVSNFYIDTKTKKSVKNVAILQHQTDSVRRELNAAITGVASSVDVNPNPNPALQILRVPSQRRQVDVQANQAILTQLVANLELSKISLRKETPLIQIIDRPILPLEMQKVSKLIAMIVGGFLSGMAMTFFLIIRSLKKYLYN